MMLRAARQIDTQIWALKQREVVTLWLKWN